jgi:cobalt-zinc-cadmium efflux system membrane fusion protein
MRCCNDTVVLFHYKIQNMYKIVFITLLVMAASCNHIPGSGSDQEAGLHEDESIVLKHTLFTDHLEFYIEHEPLEVNKEAEFLVHITALATYKPCSSGSVTLVMNGVSVTSREPSEPGIYIVPFVPGKEGSFEAEYIYHSDTLEESAPTTIEVLPPHEDLQEAESLEHVHSEASSEEIEFLKNQAWKSDFMVMEIKPAPFHAVIPTSGEIMAIPGEKKNITAGSHGIIRFADPLLVPGTAVIKGQLLFTITSESMVDDNLMLRYSEAKNRLQKSRSDYNRHLALFEQETISERQFLASRATYTEDSLRYYNLASNISEDGVRIVASVSGTVHELNVSDGEYAEPGRILAILSTNRALMLRADLPQQYYSFLNEIRSAHFRPAYTHRVFTIEETGGSLLAAGVSVAENNHYLPVIFQLENNGDLLEGAFTEVFLIAGKREKLLSVPVTALAEEQGGYYVYVQVGGESYMKRPVSIGSNDGLFVEITSGLESGERVVTEGVMLVKAASMSNGAIQAEHHH